MTEKRSLERVPLLEYQQVQDPTTGKPLGYLSDLTRDGFRVLTKKPFDVGETLSLDLRYLFVGGDWETVTVRAESLWQRKEDSAPFHETGFRIVDLDEGAVGTLERIIADLRDRDEG